LLLSKLEIETLRACVFGALEAQAGDAKRIVMWVFK
jgi:hypothetical protein